MSHPARNRGVGKYINIIHSLHNTHHYKVQIKGKWSNPGKRVAPSYTANEKGAYDVSRYFVLLLSDSVLGYSILTPR